MDYDNKTHLFEKQGNCEAFINTQITAIAEPLNPNKYLIHKLGLLTLIKPSYDPVSDRTLVRTETTPNEEIPKELTDMLKNNDFEKLV